MGTNRASLLADLFLYSNENDLLHQLIKGGKRKVARKFNLSYDYIDDLISLNNIGSDVTLPNLGEGADSTPWKLFLMTTQYHNISVLCTIRELQNTAAHFPIKHNE